MNAGIFNQPAKKGVGDACLQRFAATFESIGTERNVDPGEASDQQEYGASSHRPLAVQKSYGGV